MKHTLLLTCAAAALSACGSADFGNADDPRFERLDYVGPQTPEAVCEYVEDSIEAIEYTMDRVDGIEAAHYMPKTGRVALELEWPSKLGNYAFAGVAQAFHDRRLYITSVTELRKLGNKTRRVSGRYGGRDRVRELSNIETPNDACDVEDETFSRFKG